MSLGVALPSDAAQYYQAAAAIEKKLSNPIAPIALFDEPLEQLFSQAESLFAKAMKSLSSHPAEQSKLTQKSLSLSLLRTQVEISDFTRLRLAAAAGSSVLRDKSPAIKNPTPIGTEARIGAGGSRRADDLQSKKPPALQPAAKVTNSDMYIAFE